MNGILARGGHRFAAVGSVAEAWDFIQRNICVDLIFLEQKLDGESGLSLVQNLRADCFLKPIPVVIYTGAGDRETVRQAMALRVQDFLVKPYREDQIYNEVRKALANPWRNQHFEEEKSFCAVMGYTRDALHERLAKLGDALEALVGTLTELAEAGQFGAAVARLEALSAEAEAAGAWVAVELLGELRQRAEGGFGPGFVERLKTLQFAHRLIFAHLNPAAVPEDFVTHEERAAAAESKARAVWFDAPAEDRCPVVNWNQLAGQLDALAGCPMIDSVAAEFQMSATGHPSSLAPLMDLAEMDPGLSAHLLAAANRVRHGDDSPNSEPIENPGICVSFLGEVKLAALASGLLKAEERRMNVAPGDWAGFWMFQVGVGRMARYTCRYLSFQSLESRAYVAGLLHDIGKLLLLHLHPVGFEAMLDYARREQVAATVAEEKFLGCTTRQMGAHFASRHGLPHCYANVMRWVHDPTEATEDAVLVASVALAREMCQKNRVGWCGEFVAPEVRAMTATPAWQVLRQTLFPSFDLDRFEAEAQAECEEIKRELHGDLDTARI